MSKQLIVTIFAAAITIGPAIMHGRFANRWETPANLEAAGAQLDHLPRQIGQWENQEDERPLSEAVCQELGLAEHFHREYVHSHSGHRLQVLLMVGAPGRLVRHPPEVCYTNRANQRKGEAAVLSISSAQEPQTFKLLNFQRIAQASEFAVAYAFADSEGNWSTPNSPRMAFGAWPMLYKLQVLSEGVEAASKQDIEDFLTQFVDVFPAATVHEDPAGHISATAEQDEGK